ncbi:MAG: hypothetical protein HQL76_07095 [Magnetococcales bacterium]|nr:hypothetical protein [Magnetococcales bacterium]
MRLLKGGKAASIRPIAEQEKIDSSCVATAPRLAGPRQSAWNAALDRPEAGPKDAGMDDQRHIIKAILADLQTDVMTWRELARPFPMETESSPCVLLEGGHPLPPWQPFGQLFH